MGNSVSNNAFSNTTLSGECATKINVIKYHFIWTIKEFSFCQSGKIEYLQSSIFSTVDSGNSKWCLLLYPKVIEYKNSYISLYLRLVDSKSSEIRTKVTFRMLDNNRKADTDQLTFNHIYRNRDENSNPSRHIRIFADNDLGKNQLIDDTIIISCEINIVDTEFPIITLSNIEISPSRLSEHLGSLYESQELSDVVLCVNGKEFHCHKAILAARSPVFLAMFKHDMEEKQLSRVVIKDIDDKVFEELVRYIYTSKAPCVERLTADLLAAAEKYDVQRLKQICEEALSCTLSVETAVELLILADKHNADKLKCATIQFIVNHSIPIMSTKEWEHMIRGYPDLVIDVTRCLVSMKLIDNDAKSAN